MEGALQFDWGLVSREHQKLAIEYIGLYWNAPMRQPDLIIAPQGKPYLYRWWVRRGLEGCVYFHIQVADDPERPLHDHPWDNMSVILAGGYHETYQLNPQDGGLIHHRTLGVGDVVFRKQREAHRLEMVEGCPYTMTQFTTGPEISRWGFWYPQGWVDAREVVRTNAAGLPSTF